MLDSDDYSVLLCPNCRSLLPSQALNSDQMTACPSCNARLYVRAFPSLVRDPERGRSAEALPADDEAGCFNHPSKRAGVVCDVCGRFLCSLCDIPMGGRHMCAPCLETSKRRKQVAVLNNSRLLYDKIALACACIPLAATALFALVLVARHWNMPPSLVGKPKPRFVAAAVLAVLQLAGWAALSIFVLQK